jgi:hypothetical protein
MIHKHLFVFHWAIKIDTVDIASLNKKRTQEYSAKAAKWSSIRHPLSVPEPTNKSSH